MNLETFLDGDCYRPLPVDYRTTLIVGQICKTVVPFMTDPFKVMEVTRAESTEHFHFDYKFHSMRQGDFEGHRQLPLKLLDLRSNEELLVFRAKYRPAVIVAVDKTVDAVVREALGKARAEDYHGPSVLVVPIYAAETATHPGGVPAIVIQRTAHLVYKQFYPIFKGPPLEPGLARLDRLMPARRYPPMMDPLPFALSDKALGALLTMVRELLGAEPDSDFKALRELMAEELAAAS